MSETLAIPSSPDEPLLLHGDCLDVLARLPPKSVHVVIADPPAAIEFMGRHWDGHKGYEPRTPAGRSALRILTRMASSDATLRALGKAVESAKVATRQAEDGEPKRTAKAVEKALARALKDVKAALVEEAGELVGHRGLAPREAGFVAFMVDVWTMVSRVLVPGGIVCAWALPKTSDLAGLALRLVFGEVHDSLLHLFGEGMPKAGDVGKQIDAMLGAEREVVGKHPRPNGNAGGTTMGAGWQSEVMVTAPASSEAKRWHDWSAQLAPGWECWQIAINPTTHTLARQLLEHDTGAFNIGARRILRGEADRERRESAASQGSGLARGTVYGDANDQPAYRMDDRGSWPRNVVITTGGEHCPAKEIDRQSGVQRDGVAVKRNLPDDGARPGVTVIAGRAQRQPDRTYGASGGASRYFTRLKYTAKNSDRTMALRTGDLDEETRRHWATVKHPTVKTVDLIRWFVGLFAAKAEHTSDGQPNVVLDPFMGSGSTGVACVHERVRFIGIERDPVGDDPNADQSFHEARTRILGAIGSVELAAEVNATAPKGAQQVLF